jgi:uncharacterized membrane protein
MLTHLGATADLPLWAALLASALAIASIALLLVEQRTRERPDWTLATTGIAATAALLAAVLRPAWISARGTATLAHVVLLADTSRSMALADADGRARRDVRDATIEALQSSHKDTRFSVYGFDDGVLGPSDRLSSDGHRSDLTAALRTLAASSNERPAAVVVVSDGRFDDPPENASDSDLKTIGDLLRVPLFTIATTRMSPRDASIRRVSMAGAAVAHVPLPIRVEVGCAGGLACGRLPVTARELTSDGPPRELATGISDVRDGKAVLDLSITLDRAGTHIIEVSVTTPEGDAIADNDRRLVRLDVIRERVRVLHVAGRATNDVRALRQWLKRDASLDVVAFFILRTPEDESRAAQSELSLIPFPVDELFEEHLQSFDAVVLQDFDAQPYGLEKYLDNIRRYVRAGGGLIMVGGENAFVAGGYAGTPIADVLPIGLDGSRRTMSADTSEFTPEWTPQGLDAPILGLLREAVGHDLPPMPGANVFGDLRPGSVALLSHPTRRTPSGAPMPVLAVGEEGEGRSIALGVDGTWRLQFSELGAQTAGRGHGALWDGLLGWLMHDPRFEPAHLDFGRGCTAGLASAVRARVVSRADGRRGAVALDVTRLGDRFPQSQRISLLSADGFADFEIPPLEPGAYVARLHEGSTVLAIADFACERGGDEWADSRPDPERLASLSKATGGRFALASNARELALPRPVRVSTQRRVSPWLPSWVLTMAAATLLGLHWFMRRRDGLA